MEKIYSVGYDVKRQNLFRCYNLSLLLRYPKPVMELIEELSHGIVQPFREQQKERIQRTFVSGADAAGARLKRGIYFLLAIKYLTRG